jgi:hypothetical protein
VKAGRIEAGQRRAGSEGFRRVIVVKRPGCTEATGEIYRVSPDFLYSFSGIKTIMGVQGGKRTFSAEQGR